MFKQIHFDFEENQANVLLLRNPFASFLRHSWRVCFCITGLSRFTMPISVFKIPQKSSKYFTHLQTYYSYLLHWSLDWSLIIDFTLKDLSAVLAHTPHLHSSTQSTKSSKSNSSSCFCWNPIPPRWKTTLFGWLRCGISLPFLHDFTIMSFVGEKNIRRMGLLHGNLLEKSHSTVCWMSMSLLFHLFGTEHLQATYAIFHGHEAFLSVPFETKTWNGQPRNPVCYETQLDWCENSGSPISQLGAKPSWVSLVATSTPHQACAWNRSNANPHACTSAAMPGVRPGKKKAQARFVP